MKVTLDDFADFRTMPGDARLFKLLAKFGGTIDGVRIDIAAGFITDFASIPRLFENVVSNNDTDILRAALVHDWYYQYAGDPPGAPFKVTRAFADEVLREGMAFLGASWWKRWTVWSAVRTGGFRAWTPHALAVRALDLRYKVKRSLVIQRSLDP